MLQLHNRMKADTRYQGTVRYHEVGFPAGRTWIDKIHMLSSSDLGQASIFLPLAVFGRDIIAAECRRHRVILQPMNQPLLRTD